MKVAITHDWLNQFGGAERVLWELHQMFPDAPIYTTVYDPQCFPPEMRGWDVRTSFLQRVPLARKRQRAFFPLMPFAFEHFDLREYDVVISSSSAVAKGVLTHPEAHHICYCHTPCRFLWDAYHDYTDGLRLQALTGLAGHWLRLWDQLNSQRVGHFIANSSLVRSRIHAYYGREAEIIHPPVEVERIQPNDRPAEDFYLVVSRLVEYKRIDLAIEAANLLQRRLVVVGDGPMRRKLERLAGPTVEFVGRLDDAQVADLYARCRALLFPGLEDFGIVPVEVQAAGRPVIAYGKGGVIDTVIHGATGVLFEEQSATALARAIAEFEKVRWDPERCRRNAERFERGRFVARMQAALEREVKRGSDSGLRQRIPLELA